LHQKELKTHLTRVFRLTLSLKSPFSFRETVFGARHLPGSLLPSAPPAESNNQHIVNNQAKQTFHQSQQNTN